MLSTKLASATAVLTLLALAAACSSSDSSSDTPPSSMADAGNDTDASTTDTATIRVVHASPDAPAVDVYAEGQSEPLVKNAAYGAASPYLTVPAGTYTIQLRPAGAPSTDSPVYSTGPLSLAANAKVTAIAVGLIASTDDANKFRVLPLAESFTSAPDKATVRIVHASADAPAVGIDVGNDNAMSPEVPSLARFADTGAAGIQLEAGKALQVGIVADGKTATAFTTPELPAGGELFVIATGLLSKLPRETSGFSLLAVGPSGAIGFVKQNPTIYALHASPDAPAVDLFVGSTELADNLAFGAITKPIQVPPGSYNVDFFATSAGTARPAGSPAVTKSTGALESGQRYLVAASGFLVRSGAANGFGLFAQAENFDLSDASKGAVRAWHLSPDAPKVDIGTFASGSITPVFAGVEYPNASAAAGVLLPPASYSIGVSPAGMNSTVAATFTLPVVAGTRNIAIAAGAISADEEEQPFRLLVVNTAASPWTVASVPTDAK